MVISVSSNWIIQDPAFRRLLHDELGDTFNAEDIKNIQCCGMNISSLSGIEYFESLEYLDCAHNSLQSLDISRNLKLIKLNCGNNQLHNLNVKNNLALRFLHCENNDLSSLDISNNTELEYLECYDNAHLFMECRFGIIMRTNPYGTGIRELDTTNNRKLKFLSCSSNELTILDLSKNTQLLYLDCENNRITTLDICNTQLNDYKPNVISVSKYPLSCKMTSLKTLYLKRGWFLKGINDNAPSCIDSHTQIIYK